MCGAGARYDPRRVPAKRKPAFRRLENDERRAQLLELGRTAFSRHPYDQVSIDDLAAKAKLSKGLFYYYFPTKRDLYIAALEGTARELIDKLVTNVAQYRTPRERAVAGVEAYLDHVASQGQAFVSLMRGGIGADPSVAAVLEKVRSDLLEEFLAGNPIGAFLQQRPLSRIAIRSWIGMVEAASVEWLATPGMAKEPVRDLLVDLLFDLLTRVIGKEVSQTQLVGPVPERGKKKK